MRVVTPQSSHFLNPSRAPAHTHTAAVWCCLHADAKADANAFTNGGFAKADADATAFTNGRFAAADAKATAATSGKK